MISDTKKESVLYSGAHPGVSTLIQTKFSKTKKKKSFLFS